jgi:hypothetical protein
MKTNFTNLNEPEGGKMTKEEQIMQFLREKVFDPILSSQTASTDLRKGVNYTIMRMNQLDAVRMVSYFRSAIAGTDRSVDFATRMQEEGFTRFEEVNDEFSSKFNDEWLRS